LVWLGQWFDWRRALGIVKPETFIGWHRQGFRLFWRWKSKPERPALPKDWQGLICRSQQARWGFDNCFEISTIRLWSGL